MQRTSERHEDQCKVRSCKKAHGQHTEKDQLSLQVQLNIIANKMTGKALRVAVCNDLSILQEQLFEQLRVVDVKTDV